MSDDIIIEIRARRGAVTAIAKKCGISKAAVSKWGRVPKWHLDAVSELTGLPVDQLRPDLFCETRAA
ncbi:hypothetical protein HKD24_00135 [Gluconobacter sp. LMG 31484]|uniref:Helix-turn-helix domain-containing protein n=1 Tax=Gluconobacter vitians TaxID=2728102 RepID=A0ABR9Y105_9PROT|nr:hypothetical protein [Gluconobacter vitians]MBF0857625.1 hypothetical protein [Gluconobacter vitians]